MKNLELLPWLIQERVKKFLWRCGCGVSNLTASVTKKGTIQLHCPSCGQTIFFNDVNIFLLENPFVYQHDENCKKTAMKGGGWSFWYPKHRVRVFQFPAKERKQKIG